MSLALSVKYPALDTASFSSSPCPSLAEALFQNSSAISEEIQNCCTPSLLNRIFSSCSPTPSINQECPPLNEKFSLHQITPIHLAAMAGNLDAISEMAEKQADLNAQDVYGFSPAHHLALQGNLQGLKLLNSLNADLKLRTSDGGTVAKFLKYTAPSTNPEEWKRIEESVKNHHNIDEACLDPGVSVVDNIVATPQELTNVVWNDRDMLSIDKPSVSAPIRKYLERMQKKFAKNPPRLSVQPSSLQEKPNSPSNSCGLYAVDPIQAGEIIGYYGGELITGFRYGKESEYLMKGSVPMDGKNFRSPVAMANDSFPNACFLQIGSEEKGVDGLPYQSALVALEPIRPGEQILVNYGGSHTIKVGEHLELVHLFIKNWSNFGVKAPTIDDRKLVCIELILASLRSSIVESFHARNYLNSL